MHHLRPLLAILALSLTLPLSAVASEVYVDKAPYVVPAGETNKFTDHIETPKDYDVKGSFFWFRLEDNAILVLDMPGGCLRATVCIETAADPDHPAALHFINGYNQFTPIIFKRAPNTPNGTLELFCATWTEKNGHGYGTNSDPKWAPVSIEVDCNLTFASPLPVDSDGNAYVDKNKTFTIPSGCTFRLEAYSENPNQLPEIAFADETSTLVFALGDNVTASDESLELPEKYRKLLTSLLNSLLQIPLQLKSPAQN